MLVTSHIGEAMVELRKDRYAKALARKADKEKGVLNLLGSNLTDLLRLGQVAAHEDTPPVWKELTMALKHQQLTTLQRAFNDTDCRRRVRATIIATPGLLKITLGIGFCLDQRDDLVTGLYQFRMFQHNSAAQKVLKACAYQNQVIAGGGTALSLADTATLTASDEVSLSPTLTMARGAHTRLRVVLVTLFGPDHPTELAMRYVNMDIM